MGVCVVYVCIHTWTVCVCMCVCIRLSINISVCVCDGKEGRKIRRPDVSGGEREVVSGGMGWVDEVELGPHQRETHFIILFAFLPCSSSSSSYTHTRVWIFSLSRRRRRLYGDGSPSH